MTIPEWVMFPFGNTTTLTEGQDLEKIDPRGNDTLFSKIPPQLMDFAAVCFFVFAVIGVFGNTVSILALSKSQKLRNATTAFIVNLCVADLVFSGFSMPLSGLTFLERDWNYGDALCKLSTLVRYSNLAISLFSVIAIAINRYILIIHPSLYREMYKARNIAIMIGLIWISGTALLLFPLFEVWGKFGFDRKAKLATCTIMRLNGRSPKSAIFITSFVLPSVVFLVCYSRIYWVVHKTALKVNEEKINFRTIRNFAFFCRSKCCYRKNHRHSVNENVNTSLKRSRQELQVLKMMMIIYITFFYAFFRCLSW
ncbi:g-protein coupled receptor moody [Nephila pilipes]|uniref:G-protein coupled receptor moody n=1 Tax=Nephila pilipes TaxID=299642 RepID=A0A8X6NKD1_NEPPI|nr:g-protein coupled receptor moody [Nephila pilipes]